MFEELPMKVRIEFFCKRNSENLKKWAFPFVAVSLAVAYWPIRQMMVAQEVRVTVIASSLTVMYLVCLIIIGYSVDRIIKRRMAKRHWLMREAVFWVCMVPVFFYLNLSGYAVRW